MTKSYKKLMRKQLQESIDIIAKPSALVPVPSKGWIRVIRAALQMQAQALADRLGCQRSNISTMEKREATGAITLQSLQNVAQAMDCKLVYYLIPNETFEDILKKQAQKKVRKTVKRVNHSMKLELQGLTAKQLQQQEDEMVQELLAGNLKNLWNDDEI